MIDYIDIGSVPAEEMAAQVGQPDYEVRARQECRQFIDLIRQTIGPEPEGARLVVRSSLHDFGAYYEVAVRYDDSLPPAVEYAYRCEGDAPSTWPK